MQRWDKLFQRLLIFEIFEGLVALVWTILIPHDQKNAFFLNLSISRWVLILAISTITSFLIFTFFNQGKIIQSILLWVTKLMRGSRGIWFDLILFAFLWLTIWFPPARWWEFRYEIVRLKPILIFVILLLLESFIYIQWRIDHENGKVNPNPSIPKRILSQGLIISLFIAGLFIGLRFLTHPVTKNLSYLNPGVFISPLQLFTALLCFVTLYLIEIQSLKDINQKKVLDIITFFFIWGVVFSFWILTPFRCGGDRTSMYPPNFQCYPQVTDSIFSIGSHYITLGKGVFNHWLTDKPFYMLFLASGQWFIGQRIDQYLIFQVAVIAFIPGFLFLLGKKLTSYSGGLFIAILAAFLGSNAIRFYDTVGGVNVYTENSELLTGLFLVLLGISLFQFFNKKKLSLWALISGGLLGLATLTRINPFFILPIILIAVLLSYRSDLIKGFKFTFIILFGFSLVFLPWVVFAKDNYGNNFYITKIEKILSNRYSSSMLTSPNPPLFSDSSNVKVSRVNQKPSTQMISASVNNLYDTRTPSFSENGIGGVLFNFLNNEFQSLVKLPMNFTLDFPLTITSQPLWKNTIHEPFWNEDFSLENWIVILITLVLVVLGIIQTNKNFGMAGLVPLLIQIGYHIGNGFALTSGGRYLQPVDWVFVLYFVAGIFFITKHILSFTLKDVKGTLPLPPKEQKRKGTLAKNSEPNRTRLAFLALMVGFGVVGSFLPLTNILPDKIITLTPRELIANAKSVLLEKSKTTDVGFEQSLKNPNSIIVEGVAYHARFYSSPIVFPKKQVFEITVLGEKKVYISNFVIEEPNKQLKDGSHVILVGCKIREKNYWGAESVLINTFAIIQLDNETSTYIFKNRKFNCQ
jgi:hypothetical protein